MKKIVFLLEEPSMKVLLDNLLPRLLSSLEIDTSEVSFKTIPHEGKQDLEKSIPRKLRAWREPGVRFIIVRDQDGADCIRLKKRLYQLCVDAGRDDSVVRIACNELESWFLGDLGAVAAAYNKPEIARLKNKAKFREPDNLSNAAQELKRLIPRYQKLKGARLIAPYIDYRRNHSNSFLILVEGIVRAIGSWR
ncbi:conserved hypothetical protein [Desulfofarcimen acetoxidans DSM 771]|uniref:Cytoplasmic protein n=1 Tax=Desulfofarcimen acetoxidans (strain ATCC 49208 / DSM 771 / KCTC 5769 / VKM B-1644 / 5575) TaxID=485916 RepID=C8W2N7_DESAS|nr:DUF4276 family protein [Desulfofarcimen acetoxidans]ACV63721.1 conserved hypothetical protein [Desulfofarcimen acetoxidans DSM 771]